MASSQTARERVTDAVRHWWHVVDGQPTVDRLTIAGDVLDVGAGEGHAVAYFIRRGHRVIGIEPNQTTAASAVARGLPVLNVRLEEFEYPAESFDTIVLNQVIEHLTDPRAALRRLLQLLRPQGRLAILTPNAEGLPARIFGAEWAHWHPPYHLYLFGAKQLERLLRDSGFVVKRRATVTPAFWINMSVKLWRHASQRTGWTLPPTGWQPTRVTRLAVAPVLRILDVTRQGDCLIVEASHGT